MTQRFRFISGILGASGHKIYNENAKLKKTKFLFLSIKISNTNAACKIPAQTCIEHKKDDISLSRDDVVDKSEAKYTLYSE